MREAWTEVILGDAVTVQKGKKPPSLVTSEESSHPYLTADVLRGATCEQFVPGEQIGPCIQLNGRETILLWDGAGAGDVFRSQPGVLASTMAKLVAQDSHSIDDGFLFLFLKSKQDAIKSSCRGTTVPHVSPESLKSLKLLLPPLIEQRRIVDLTSAVDSYVAALQQHMEAARVLRNAIEVAEFDNPENELSLLGDYCDKTDIQVGPFGSQLHQREYVADGIPVIMPKDIIDGRISGRTIARVTPEKASELKRHLLIPGDVLFARRGDLSKRALVNETQAGWLCGTGTVRVRSGKLDGEILFRLSNTSSVNSWLMDNSVGATMPNLNSSIVAAIPLRVPGNASEAVALLRAMDKYISGTTDLLSSAKELRSGLLSDLLSGAHEIPGSYDRLLGVA